MLVTCRPRLEHVSFSLYWKEPLHIQTSSLPDVSLDLGKPASEATREEVLAAAERALGWPSEETLLRLEHFKDPWQRVIVGGREVEPGAQLSSVGYRADESKGKQPIVVVRHVLKADGWRIAPVDDFLSDDDDDDTEEAKLQ